MFPMRGKLRSLSSQVATLFGYISDDCTWISVELKQGIPILPKRREEEVANEQIKKLKDKYLNLWTTLDEGHYKPA